MQIFECPESQLKRCIFVGPSLRGVGLDHTIMRFGPAQLGSVYLAAKSRYNVIGLVDAIFGNVPTVWHKEILYAIGRGCVVYGSSSAGALRAAELHTYGMHGIGLTLRAFNQRASHISKATPKWLFDGEPRGRDHYPVQDDSFL